MTVFHFPRTILLYHSALSQGALPLLLLSVITAFKFVKAKLGILLYLCVFVPMGYSGLPQQICLSQLFSLSSPLWLPTSRSHCQALPLSTLHTGKPGLREIDCNLPMSQSSSGWIKDSSLWCTALTSPPWRQMALYCLVSFMVYIKGENSHHC